MTQLALLITLSLCLQLAGCKGDQHRAAGDPGAAVGDTKPAVDDDTSLNFKGIQELLGAINSRDWPAAANWYDSKARWSVPAGALGEEDPLVVVGRDKVVAMWRELANWMPDLALVATRVIRLKRGFLVESWTGGRAAASVPGRGVVKGARLGVRSAEVLTITGGRITSVLAFGDGAAARAQLAGKGSPEPRPVADRVVAEVSGPTGARNVASAIATVGGARPSWTEGVGNLVVLAQGRTLWIVAFNATGEVVDKRRYTSVR